MKWRLQRVELPCRRAFHPLLLREDLPDWPPSVLLRKSSNILTPVRNTSRSFALTKEGVAVGDVFTLDLLKHFIEEAEEHASLTAEVATAGGSSTRWRRH